LAISGVGDSMDKKIGAATSHILTQGRVSRRDHELLDPATGSSVRRVRVLLNLPAAGSFRCGVA
jgi:hypothetical protein